MFKPQVSFYALFILAALLPISTDTSIAGPRQDSSYSKQIRPILATKCLGCHQGSLRGGGLLMATWEDLKRGGQHGPSITEGNPEGSLIVRHLTGVAEPRMPFGMAPLTESEIDLFRRWIREGAKDDSSFISDADPIPTATPEYHASPVITALAYSPDGKLLAISGNHEIILHKTDGSGIEGHLVGRSERIHSIVISRDGKMLVAVGGSPARFGEIQFWDLPNRKLQRAVKIGDDTLFGASISADGKLVAFGCADKTIRIYDATTFAELRKMENHGDWVFGTIFSVDGRRLVSVSRDHFLKLSEVATGQFLENLNLLTKATFGGQGELYALARHPKSDIVVAAGDDRVPRLYTLNRPRAIKIDDDSCLLRELEAQGGPVETVAFNPDGSQIAVGGMGEAVNIYASHDGSKSAELKGHHAAIYALAFDPSGNRIATSGFDGTVRIYDLGSKSLLKEFIPVNIVAPSLKGSGHF